MSALPPRSPARTPPGPKPRLGSDPRDRLYEATLACISRSGIRGTSMDDVAREAGVSRPTVYYYFANKNDLIAEVVVRQAGSILRDIRRKLGHKAGVDRVIEAAYMEIKAALENEYVRLLIAPDSAALLGSLAETGPILSIRQEFWRPILEQARECGELRSDRDLDDLAHWITFLEFTLAVHAHQFGLTLAEIRDRLNAYLRPALRVS